MQNKKNYKMKTTLILLAALTLSLSAFSQTKTRVRVNEESVGYATLVNDTMQVVKSDRIYKGSIYVPSYSTDSTTVTGCTFTVDGHAMNGILIPPGEIAVNFGFDYAVSDTVNIISNGTTWVVLAKER